MTSEPVLQPMPRDKADLMARIPPARAALEEIIQPLSETQLSQQGLDVGWAVKDHLAHVATWEHMLCAHLRDGSDHAVVGLESEQYATMSLDELNAHIDRLNHDRGATEVMAHFHDAHRELMALLASMSDAQFDAPYWQDEPEGRPVRDKVAGDTYNHYIEHRAWIQAILDARTGRSG